MSFGTIRLLSRPVRYNSYPSGPRSLPFRLLCHSGRESLSSRRQYSSAGQIAPPSPLVEPLLNVTYNALETLHSATGLTWALTIPLAALLIRTVFVLPAAIYAREAARRADDMRPLSLAWQHQIQRRIVRESGSLGPVACTKLARKALKEKHRELSKRFRCNPLRVWTPILTSLPVFFTVVETLRRMCGGEEGLLGILLRQLKPGSSRVNPINEDSASSLTSLGEDGASSAFAHVVSIEPTFATEGALWFPNLLEADPHLYLPLILSASFFATAARIKKPDRPRNDWVGKLALGNIKVLKALPFVVFPLTLQVPSALMLYWITTISAGVLQNEMLDRYYGLKSHSNSKL